MSQSGLLDPTREAEWDAWYVGHLAIMRTVPGITSAVRFRTASPGHPPSLAMYTVASDAVFRDPYYLSVRGMGEWKPLIDPRFYRRNLFEGLDVAPSVGRDERLLVADRPERDLRMVEFTWLKAAGLDASTPFRGIAVARASAARASHQPDVAIYEPVAG